MVISTLSGVLNARTLGSRPNGRLTRGGWGQMGKVPQRQQKTVPMSEAPTIDFASSASVESVLDLISSMNRLLAPATEYEAMLPGLCRLLVPDWAGGCGIGLFDEDGSLRTICEEGSARLDAASRRVGAQQRAATVSEPSGWKLELPISARSEPIGVLQLTGSGTEPSGVLSRLADVFSLRIAIAIDTARTIAREHHVADTLQRALLPQSLPQTPHVSFDAAYRPGATEAIIGGDWYDAFELPDGRVALSIGDVAGHGLRAAVIMSEVRQAVRAAALDADVPSQVLARVNQMLTLRPLPTMVTACFGIYDPGPSTFTYATAGHPAPILATSDGRAVALPSRGVPLGIVEDISARDWTFSLLPDTLLVLYTDGLIEYSRDVLAGEGLLRDAVCAEMEEHSATPAQSLQERIFATTVNNDDVATLTLYVAPRHQDRFEYTFSAVPFAAPLVRHALEGYATQLGLDEDRRFSLLYAVGEAVANAIEHAYSDGEGTIHVNANYVGNALRVEVEDFGRWRASQKHEERGRGIPLMRALMDGVEIQTDQSSTKIRMRMAL